MINLLRLQKKKITAMSSSDFQGLNSLKKLSLSSNRLTSLPAGVFQGLCSLRELVLHKNSQLKAISEVKKIGKQCNSTIWINF